MFRKKHRLGNRRDLLRDERGEPVVRKTGRVVSTLVRDLEWGRRPRVWLYSINARVGRGLIGSVPATAAGKLSSTKRLGQPWKKAHARSSPSMVASTAWWTSGHKKLRRL